MKWIAMGMATVAIAAIVCMLLAGSQHEQEPAVSSHTHGAGATATPGIARPLARTSPRPSKVTTAQPILDGPTVLVESTPPLRPVDENRRLLNILDASGESKDDELEHQARVLLGDLVTQVEAHGAILKEHEVVCHAAGCVVTVALASSDYYRNEQLLRGVARESAAQKWPGGRIVPPPMSGDGVTRTRMFLIRADSKTQF